MKIELPIDSRPVPLTLDTSGRWRVTGTRIPLERVVEHFHGGQTPEQIVDCYDTLRLSDVYAVISYYLDHRVIVDAYVRQMEAEGDAMESFIKERLPLRPGLKEEILARWARREALNAAARQ